MGGKDFTARKLTWLMSSEAAPRIIFCQLRPKTQHKKKTIVVTERLQVWSSPCPWTSNVCSLSILSSAVAASTHQSTEKLILYCVLPSFPLPLHLYSMTGGFFSFYERAHHHFLPRGAMTSQTPPIRTLVMQLFLCILPWHVPPRCTPNMADGRESPAWFPKTTPGAQNPRSCFQPAFSCFFFFSVRQMCCCKIFLVTGNVKKEKYIYFSCRSHFLESAGEARNKASSYERKEKQLLYLLMLNDSD